MIGIFTLLTSLIFNLDEKLIKALIKTETSNKCNSLFVCEMKSKTRDRGILQINEKYAEVHNLDWLYNNEFNIHLAGKKLSENKKRLKDRKYWWVSYNTGIEGFRNLENPSKHN